MKPEPKAPPSKAALLLIDVINHFEFPDGERTLRQAMAIAPRIARLKARASAAGIPTVYVNDNFGYWRSEASKLVEYCTREGAPSRKFVEQVRPDPEDYFVLKPMHSAFYQTPLELLLRNLGAKTLILCGLATNSCVVCTAHDARMRNFRLFVPSDCTAARSKREHAQAITHIASMAGADTSSSASLKLRDLVRA
ncbi:MAG TPA: isochorismatase family cysteine hydrolase [Bryobacteraceae bacterium]